jgi:hypothetical protein
MYEPPIQISTISDESIAKTMHYFASFGIELTVEKIETPRRYQIQNKQYLTQQSIETMTFQVSESGYLYTIRFKFLSR